MPKMAVRTLKKTAIGNIRSTENPNKTIQDSEKLYMLCGDCEDLFSEKETWFANKIFHPYLKKEKTIFDYDENLAYFITSVNWRSLYLDILDFVENSVVGIDALECLIESEKIMNEFLRGKRNDLGKIENHIFFFDDIKELFVDASNFADLKPHATFHRGIGSYTFCYEDEKTYGTLTNMMGVILVTLYHKGQREVWNNTEILNGVGRIEAKDQQIQSVFGNELIHIMETAKKASEAMSVAQQKKAEDRIKAAGEDVKNFFVLLVSLKKKEYDEKTIATLSKLIPQNILFALEYENESRLAIYHTKVMQTAWIPTEEQKVELKGLNLDTVWENIVIAVGGLNIEKGNTLDEQIEINEKKQKLEKEIAKLEKQARAEKQPKKKFELVQAEKKLKEKLKLLEG